MKRRNFLKTAAASGAALGVGALGLSELNNSSENTALEIGRVQGDDWNYQQKKPPVPAGYFVLAHPGNSRIALSGQEKGSYIVVDAHTGEFRHEKTNLFKAHAGHRPLHNNPEKLSYFVGHNDGGQIEVYDAGFRRINTLVFDKVLFRGHIVDHGDTMLATAIDSTELRYETSITRNVASDPDAALPKDGLLFQFTADGKEVARHRIKGIRPHQIIDCGDHYAISCYGNYGKDNPRHPEFDRFEREGGDEPLGYNAAFPGVCIVDKATLSVRRFVKLPSYGLCTHVAQDHKGNVLAMQATTRWCGPNPNTIYKYAERDGSIILSSEVERMQYDEGLPIFDIDVTTGEFTEVDFGRHLMRRAANFDFDPETGVLITTFGCSQTMMVRDARGNDTLVDTLAMGISDPRGGCFIPESGGLFAICGGESGIAVFDPKDPYDVLWTYNVPTGYQAHLQWFAA